jgi:hypothetical protein
MGDLMTKADVSRVAGLTPAAITAAALRGDLRVAARTAGGTRLFASEDVEGFLRRREAKRERAK